MISKKKHQRHAKLAKPSYGNFHRNEWAIIGTSHGKIQEIASQIIAALSTTNYKLAYVDADSPEEGIAPKVDFVLDAGATLSYTDKFTHRRINFKAKLDTYQYRELFNDQDLVLVNGNHFVARQQIVILDPKNEVALSQKLGQLTDVVLILTTNEVVVPYPYLKEHLGEKEVPMIHWKDIEKIKDFLEEEMKKRQAVLKGLVLAGGKSQRMGKDKGAIRYHGIPQRDYAANLMNSFCTETYISVRADQANELDSPFPIVRDTFDGLGPFGAILSAFRQDPEAAWLVVACDLPLLDEKTLKQLVDSRNPSDMATAFNSPHNDFPEPLITIWEPRSYPVLLQFLAQGYSCPRKALINAPVTLIDPINPKSLMNVNHPEEYQEVIEMIKRH